MTRYDPYLTRFDQFLDQILDDDRVPDSTGQYGEDPYWPYMARYQEVPLRGTLVLGTLEASSI